MTAHELARALLAGPDAEVRLVRGRLVCDRRAANGRKDCEALAWVDDETGGLWPDGGGVCGCCYGVEPLCCYCD